MTIRPCWVEIHTRALEDNFRFLLTLAAPHAELLAVLKADAYGHSMALCAPAVVRAGARWLGVASVEEGVSARALCPEAKVLVLCGAFPGEGAAIVRDGLTAVVWQPWQLDELESAAREAGMGAGSVPVHLEIDTGMSRQGASLEALSALLARFSITSPRPLTKVEIYWAKANSDVMKREWLALSATKTGDNLYQAKLPAEAADWFAVTSDDRPVTVSSDLIQVAAPASKHPRNKPQQFELRWLGRRIFFGGGANELRPFDLGRSRHFAPSHHAITLRKASWTRRPCGSCYRILP